MKNAAVGFRVHSGWAAMIALAVKNSTPVVLIRARIHLVNTFTYKFRQPYHTAERMPPTEGRAFVARAKSEARRLAFQAIRDAGANLQAQGYKLTVCAVLLASGKPLPPLAKILASHALIHTADGELFREALSHASARCNLLCTKRKARDLLNEASRTLRIKPTNLARQIAELGRPLGPPWTQDEKFASLAAWLAISPRQSHSSELR